MKRSVKILTFIGALLLIIGSLIFVKALGDNNWKFENIEPNKLQTNVYELDKEFKNISIETDTTDVEFVLSIDNKNKVVINERKDELHQVNIIEDTLSIIEKDDDKIHFSLFNFNSPKMTIYLVSNQYNALFIDADTSDIIVPKDFVFNSVDIETDTGDVSFTSNVEEKLHIETNTGNIKISSIKINSALLEVTTGDININSLICDDELSINVTTGECVLNDINCASFVSKGGTGDVEIKDVIAKEKISIKRTTGDVFFNKMDASEIYIETDTGDVKGTFISEKIFKVETSTGDRIYPSTSTGGKCEIITTTGDVIVKIGD